MMYGHEKSDLAIVAVKPANKAERSSAKSAYRPVSRHGSGCGKPRPFRIFAFPLVSCSSIVYQRFTWVQTGLGQCHEASTASHQQK
jgi:hypothetical protein